MMFGVWLSTLTQTAAASTSITTQTALTSLPLMTKGLLTTLFGLLGVFLVLLLFFVAIKLMQNIGKKAKSEES